MRATSGSTSSRMSASAMMLPGPLRDADLLRRASRASRTVRAGSRARPAGSRAPACRRAATSTCPWWSAPQMSIEVREAAGELVAVVREVVAEVGGRAVGAHEHTVAVVAEVGRPQPLRAVVLVGDAALVEVCEHVARLRRVRATCAPRTTCRSARRCGRGRPGARADDVPVAPRARGRRASTSSPSSARSCAAMSIEVLTLVPVFGRRLALVAGVERVPELPELPAGVVQVVLAVHLGALRREQVGDRVADRDPAPAAGVERAGRVGRHELQVDAPAGQRVRGPVAVGLRATTWRRTSRATTGRGRG